MTLPFGYSVGDCRALLRTLPDESVNCVVTSPPYWGLRNYDDCEGQIGLEETFGEWVATMVEVFAEVRRVLRSDGTLWLNCGDAYNSGTTAVRKADYTRPADSQFGKHGYWANPRINKRVNAPGLKRKDLIGMAWELAFALRDDGWWLRCDIIWEKPACMPEAITDRPTKSHEYLFLMSKSEKYWYDADAIKEPTTGESHSRGTGINPKAVVPGKNEVTGDRRKVGFNARWKNKVKQNQSFSSNVSGLVDARNKRSVWRIPTEPSSDEHFAAFPTKLVTPCILAGCPAGGVVLDPFGGTGTVGRVAEDLGRKWILFDLNPKYQAIAKRKTAQIGLLGRTA